MTSHSASLAPDFLNELESAGLETHTDPISRTLYSTDASLYQIRPLGVAFPRTADHLNTAVELAAQYSVPIIARGAGSGLAGQSLGQGLILDCSRHLNKILEIDSEAQTAVVQPGMVLDTFNHQVGQHGLQFGPDPASSERATIGGALSNNATGAHSIQYGMSADHILEAEVVLGDGTQATFGEISIEQAIHYANNTDPHSTLYQTALDIRNGYAEIIPQKWAQVWRRASGYSLNYLIPWSATRPPRWSAQWSVTGDQYPPIRAGHLNLAPLFAGAEGTLGVIRTAKVNLVRKPQYTILGVLAYDSIADACDDTPRLLEFGPSAVELITRRIVHLARAVPAYAQLIDFLPPGENDPAALLVVEFAANSAIELEQKVKVLGPKTYIASSSAAQARIWKVRKVGLGLLMSKPGNAQPLPFIEDVAVPVEKLGDFVRAVNRICDHHGVEPAYYAHASAGCLHIRPILDLRTEKDILSMREIAAAAIEVGLEFGGAVSGEHGDGLARSEWLEKAYGPEIMQAHRLLKQAADPQGILNPGKIIDAPPMDQNLRFGVDYQATAWQPIMSFDHQVSLENAIEMCNGAGVCRKDGGVMCPSFQATRDELHSTRGRANLLRELIRGESQNDPQDTPNSTPLTTADDVFAALELCLACKGCKSECPSAVDMAKLKYEFMAHYYHTHPHKLRDYIFGYFSTIAQMGAPFRKLVNWGMENNPIWRSIAALLDLAPDRKFPLFQENHQLQELTIENDSQGAQTVLFLLDDFTKHNHPEVGAAALKTLAAAGYQAQLIPVAGGSGRTLISKGFLKAAKNQARKVVKAIHELDPGGKLPIVGVEPSEIYTLSDEYSDFFPTDKAVSGIANRAWMVDEFLVRHSTSLQQQIGQEQPEVLLHGHCYQKARPPAADGFPTGVTATASFLEKFGFKVTVIAAGCCGMAGAFGYEAEHFEVSMQIGELALFPVVRQAGQNVIIAASGVSCQAQIEDGTTKNVVHPIELAAALLVPSTP
jgi:FAD/FMN-containing dehydrogenase/Fe-S oxidoreductase